MANPADVQATFCATLVDSWISLGLRQAMVAPGSRSTPMALALASRDELHVHVLHDERSASFAALGVGLATGRPAVLLCTSGTAATHFHGAVVEAGLSNVAMLVLTADRPPELRDVGAPQTIDQTRLYGSAPRWFHDPGVPVAAASGSWRSLAAQAWSAAVGVDPGPVHLNLPFREPLVGAADVLPPAIQRTWEDPQLAAGDVAHLARRVGGRTGLLIAGRGADAATVDRLADALGWPVLADPRSGCRHLLNAVSAFDSIVRSAAFVGGHAPEVAIRIGEPPASKVLAQWLASCGAVQVQLDGSTRVFDPDQLVAVRIAGAVGPTCAALAEAVTGPAPERWATAWTDAERVAQTAIESATGGTAGNGNGNGNALSEPAVARLLTSGVLGAGAHLVVASSMPIRDVEWYGGTGAGTVVHANRGANGIDGVVATAIGVAASTGARTVALLGDVALCHDASSLTALAGRKLDLTIVVVDNDGGGIFSFLPQAESLPTARFEQLFGTPHGTDVVALAAAHGIAARTATSAVELSDSIAGRGTSLVRVVSDRDANVGVHRRINADVVAALDAR
ncbi:MAG: 2-succinyl-5-enolpyruvyl-6-hydroxy-3-cyclohexene-1-carboxylic-acid synthase [Ilumatobacteraceae bacterium]